MSVAALRRHAREARRVSEAEGRLGDQVSGQWGDLEAAFLALTGEQR